MKIQYNWSCIHRNCQLHQDKQPIQIEDHYSQLLGVQSEWNMSDVDLDIAGE
ncbi:hypothetical protein P3339_13680 [Microbulbifer sp. MLAF003]|uniref:hypothetical protein n=1 Tax=Microbulbifer TaxID=48073 RepID=UPI0003A41E5D|nr:MULTISPECIES: hypothetical protein [Microbulbifer]WHI49520.1 hypothetical protein P3339_13680 [Microbulbifer sp. MLAF003]